MAKIKKRVHWNELNAPRRPRVPIEPKKNFSNLEVIFIQDEDCGNKLSLERLKMPDNFTYKDLIISIEWDETKYRIYVYLNKSWPNANYDKEYLKYSKDLVKYEKDLKLWEKEIIEYDTWKKQCEEELLQKKIKEVKIFLKKYDKISK